MSKPIPYAVTWASEKHSCDADYDERCTDQCFARVFRMAQWPERGRRLWDAVEAIRKERRNQPQYFEHRDKSDLLYQGVINGHITIEWCICANTFDSPKLVLADENDHIVSDVMFGSSQQLHFGIPCYNAKYACSHPVAIMSKDQYGRTEVVYKGPGTSAIVKVLVRREAHEVESRKT